MKELETKEFQDKYCKLYGKATELLKQNDINFYPAFGTLLGCIREKDIIAWDNDIDNVIDRENFIKLKELFKDDNDLFYFKDFENGDEIFGLCRIYCKNLYRKLSDEEKSRNAYFDFFIYENVKDIDKFKKINKKNFKLEELYFLKVSDTKPKNIIKRILKPIVKTLLFSQKKYNQIMNNRFKSNVLGDNATVLLHPDKVPFLFTKFEGKCEKDFHNFKINVPKNYDEILKIMYGENYMTPVDYGNNCGTRFFEE